MIKLRHCSEPQATPAPPAAPAQGGAEPPSAAAEQQHLAASRSQLAQAGLLPVLFSLSLEEGGAASAPVRARALHCIAALVNGHAANQTALAKATVKRQGRAQPALHAALAAALHGGGSGGEVAAAMSIIASFCEGNPNGQTTLVSTLAPGKRKKLHADDTSLSLGLCAVPAAKACTCLLNGCMHAGLPTRHWRAAYCSCAEIHRLGFLFESDCFYSFVPLQAARVPSHLVASLCRRCRRRPHHLLAVPRLAACPRRATALPPSCRSCCCATPRPSSAR